MKLADTFPTNKIGDLEYRVGRVFPFGATLVDPYAKSVTGRNVWGKKAAKKLPSLRGQIIREDYHWEGDTHCK